MIIVTEELFVEIVSSGVKLWFMIILDADVGEALWVTLTCGWIRR